MSRAAKALGQSVSLAHEALNLEVCSQRQTLSQLSRLFRPLPALGCDMLELRKPT